MPRQCVTFCLRPEERLAGDSQAMHNRLFTAWSTDDRRHFLAFKVDIYLTQTLSSGTLELWPFKYSVFKSFIVEGEKGEKNRKG